MYRSCLTFLDEYSSERARSSASQEVNYENCEVVDLTLQRFDEVSSRNVIPRTGYSMQDVSAPSHSRCAPGSKLNIVPGPSIAARSEVQNKEQLFANFIANEMKKINNVSIYNETKWKIHLTLMEGIKQDEAAARAIRRGPLSTSFPVRLMAKNVTPKSYSKKWPKLLPFKKQWLVTASQQRLKPMTQQ